jgi:hypothetical protein
MALGPARSRSLWIASAPVGVCRRGRHFAHAGDRSRARGCCGRVTSQSGWPFVHHRGPVRVGFRRHVRSEAARLKFDLAHRAEQLTVVRAKTFAYQGLGRRMHSIERCVVNIFAIYPPDRRQFLSHDECTDARIQFQAFAMNVYALFDNVTWVCLSQSASSPKYRPQRRKQGVNSIIDQAALLSNDESGQRVGPVATYNLPCSSGAALHCDAHGASDRPSISTTRRHIPSARKVSAGTDASLKA